MDLARWWPLLVGVAAIAGAIVWSVVASRRRPIRMRRCMDEDARDPFRRWVQAVFLLVSGDCDYAYLPSLHAVRLLARWWEVYGPAELRRVLLTLETDSDHAWSLVRFIVVTRLGVGARWLVPDEAWTRTRPVARRLCAAYEDWTAMAHAYVVARRAAMGLATDGSEDDDDMRAILANIATLRDTVWRETAFRDPEVFA